MATAPRPIFAQPDDKSVYAQHSAMVEQLEARFRKAAEMPGAARAGILAYASFPRAHWRQIWSGNPRERLNREIRRRTGGAGIFPNRQATVRLAGAVPAERTASGKRPAAT